MACCGWIETYWRQINLLLAIIGLFLSVFDLASDWWVFSEYVNYGGGEVAAALGTICFIGTMLFFVEVYVAVIAIIFYSKKHPDASSGSDEEDDDDEEGDADDNVDADVAKEEKKGLNTAEKTNNQEEAPTEGNHEKYALPEFQADEDPALTAVQLEEMRVSRWEEVVSFLLLILQDLPTVTIICYAFEEGNCEAFQRIYQDTYAAYVALLSAFLSSLWKGISSFRYCCRCRFHDLRGQQARFFCCVCRIFRPVAALSLCSFIAYMFFEIQEMRRLPPLSDDFCEHITLARKLY